MAQPRLGFDQSGFEQVAEEIDKVNFTEQNHDLELYLQTQKNQSKASLQNCQKQQNNHHHQHQSLKEYLYQNLKFKLACQSAG